MSQKFNEGYILGYKEAVGDIEILSFTGMDLDTKYTITSTLRATADGLERWFKERYGNEVN